MCLFDENDFSNYVECVEYDGVSDYDSNVKSEQVLSVFHTNIRSFNKNCNNLFVTLANIKSRFHVVCITETWHNEDSLGIDMEGYDSFKTTGKINRNDGTVVFVRKELSASVKEVVLGDVYGLSLNFMFRNRKFCILAVYRTHDSNKDVFIDALDIYYRNKCKQTSYVFLGDINLDIIQGSAYADRYLNTLLGSGFVSAINIPTRVTEDSRSCIDHIFVDHNDLGRTRAGVLHTHISDHFSTVLDIQFDNDNICSDPPTKGLRPGTFINKQIFKSLVYKQNWDLVTSVHDMSESAGLFETIITDLVTRSTQVNAEFSSKYRPLKPWITKGIMTSIRKRDKLSKLVHKQPFNVDLKARFVNYRNKLNSLLKDVKQNYYKDQIKKCGNNPKRLWKVINEISGKKSNKDSFPINKFTDNQEGYPNEDSHKQVANDFNEYFANVGNNLASKIISGGIPVVDDNDHVAESVFVMRQATEADVLFYVNGLRGGSAPGCDGVAASLLKDNVNSFISPLRHIINLSVESGVFPDTLKTAKVIPLYKSNDIREKSNYRPISLLSVFSKVIEKFVKDQFIDYLSANTILSNFQYGFRKDKNINDALYMLTKNINDAITRNRKSLIIFLDLAKAFDSVDRGKLLQKLKLVGCRDQSLSWFDSYLANRKQIVSINGVVSDEADVEFGVIQGSTLGPVLFLIYINNLTKLNIPGKFFLFADDSAILIEGDSWEDVKCTAERVLELVKTWFDQNILSLNVLKTKFLPISLAPKSDPNFNYLTLHSCGNLQNDFCQCEIIERVDCYKYLGVIFDTRLKWSAHIDYIKTKTRKFIYVFRELRAVLNLNELKLAYFAYCQSIFLGGIIAWGGCYKSILEPLNVVQRCILKSALGENRRFPTAELFEVFDVLSIRKLFVRTLLLFISTNSNLIFRTSDHEYYTRSSVRVGIQTPLINKTFSTTNSHYIAHILHRNVPADIRDLGRSSIYVYKKRVNRWIVQLGRDEIERFIISDYR